eukprot:9939167-Alexandrium_andersonii.AAC.1
MQTRAESSTHIGLSARERPNTQTHARVHARAVRTRQPEIVLSRARWRLRKCSNGCLTSSSLEAFWNSAEALRS